jgi:hypothetical protein
LWWSESQQQARASQARKLSLPLPAPEEREAGNGAGPLVVAQEEPSWACTVCPKQMARCREGREATACVVRRDQHRAISPLRPIARALKRAVPLAPRAHQERTHLAAPQGPGCQQHASMPLSEFMATQKTTQDTALPSQRMLGVVGGGLPGGVVGVRSGCFGL